MIEIVSRDYSGFAVREQPWDWVVQQK